MLMVEDCRGGSWETGIEGHSITPTNARHRSCDGIWAIRVRAHVNVWTKEVGLKRAIEALVCPFVLYPLQHSCS
jgi:hypothetical protein